MKPKHQLISAMLMAAGLLAGCGTPQISRIDRNRDIYETWPIETRQAVLDGKVEAGMTPDMVRVSWGEPTEKMASPNGTDEEIWVWRKGGDDGTMMSPMGGSSIGMGGPMIGMGGPGIGISTGRGGTSIGGIGGIGIGGGIGSSGIGISPSIGLGGGGGGMGTPIMTRPTPAEEKEVVFRGGVVYRADSP